MTIPFHTTAGMIDLWSLSDTDVALEALGDTLAKINRFNGRTPVPWSVASHAMLVERLVEDPSLKGWALLHDAHEAFLGDITTPALELLAMVGGRAVIERTVQIAKGRLDRAIGRAWECVPSSHSLEIRRADWLALQAETAIFFRAPLSAHSEEDRDAILAVCEIVPEIPAQSWLAARDGWIQRARELAAMGLLRLPRQVSPALAGQSH